MFLERLNEFMTSNNLKQKDIINKTGVSASYMSMLLKGQREPNKILLEGLSKISEKSINWWLTGEDDYNNLHSLNNLIDFFIKQGDITDVDNIDPYHWEMLTTMLKKEIDVKLQKTQQS